ncbi:hypothetical protein ABW19_dt0207782 [Dactylella cylindrospora]|nr:hypothetical protein ABW19_dt0207782 [Dactylella cylindrospora]
MTVRLLDLLSPAYPILQTTILDSLQPQDIIRLLATCRTLQQLKPYIWSVNRSLRRFVDDPIAFRSLMARHNALVSGSHALQFLRRVKWLDSDLDVYIYGLDEIFEFATHLMEKEEYEFSPYQWQSSDPFKAARDRKEELEAFMASKFEAMDANAEPFDPFDDGNSDTALYIMSRIDGVFNFIHKRNKDLRIQLISSCITPLNSILGDFYATHIFNFFSWNRAYSIFPYHTFNDERAYTTGRLTHKASRGVEKYQRRGYAFADYGEKHECVKNCPFRPHRKVGDKYCWVMDLDTEGLENVQVTVPQSVLESSTFGMKMHKSWWDKEDNQRVFMQLPCIQITYKWDLSDVFRYPRLIDLQTHSWEAFIESMKKTFQGFGGYRVSFPEGKDKDLGESGKLYLDGEFDTWYEFWEKSIMPNDNIWRYQYPMLA